uniref:DNA-directed RNA polymerase subunit beta'' n=1 Tax=Rotundella rotunda TaxID=1357779 RepID=A0A140GII1_9CHLO|nr:beta subunit of RNA polymerase [Rotundella rotunda]
MKKFLSTYLDKNLKNNLYAYSKIKKENSLNFISSSFFLQRFKVIKKRRKSICFSTLSLNSLNSNIFWNFSFDKGRLKSFVSLFLKTHGEFKTILLLENLKDLGFGYATKAGISLGIDDLKIPPQKAELLYQAETKILKGVTNYKNGRITGIERLQQLIETWNQTSETLKQEVIRYFESTDPLNPVYMMAFSGARGNLSQVRQLVGMRGLMADPQGQIIDFPIQSNFREGLTLTEYLISTYGARKGIVDTALRTATAGYLTRRLVDVAQHVIVAQFDCGTMRGIFVFDMKDGNKTIYSFQNRLIGRVLAEPIYEKKSTLLIEGKIASRNQEISSELALSISKIVKKAIVRSPLTCETGKSICQLCYGWSLSSTHLVSIGEAVGVIAAQSIGEPGTQLTMRTFHTGGVFSGGLTDQILAIYDGIIEYLEPVPGCCIRTPDGQIAFLTKMPVSFSLRKKSESFEIKPSIRETYKIPAYSILFARNRQEVTKKQLLAQFSTVSTEQSVQGNAEQTVYSTLDGQLYFSQINLIEQKNEKYEDLIRKTEDWAKIWILSGRLYYDPLNSSFFGKAGDLVKKTSVLNQIEWQTTENGLLTKYISTFDFKPIFKKKKFISNTLDSTTLNPIFTKQIKEKEIEGRRLSMNPKIPLKQSFKMLLINISQRKNIENFHKIKENKKRTKVKFESLKIHSLSTKKENYKELKTIPPFYLSYTHLKRKTVFRQFLRFNFFSGTLQKILEIHAKNKNIFKNYCSSLNVKNSQDPFWLFRNLNRKKIRLSENSFSNSFNMKLFSGWSSFMPMFLDQKKKQKSIEFIFKKEVKKIKVVPTLRFPSPSLKEKKNPAISSFFALSTIYSFSHEKKQRKTETKKSSQMKKTKNFFLKKETLFCKSKNRLQPQKKNFLRENSLILRKPILVLDFHKICYQNIGYNFSLNLENPFFSFSSTKNTLLKNYQNLKFHYYKKVNLKNPMSFIKSRFYKDKNRKILNKNIRKEKFLSFMTLNGSKTISKVDYNQSNLGQHFSKDSFNSTQQWNKNPNLFFYWLPSTTQTSTNGLFMMLTSSSLYMNHQKWKRKPFINPWFLLSKDQNPLLSFKDWKERKIRKKKLFLDIKSWIFLNFVCNNSDILRKKEYKNEKFKKRLKIKFIKLKSTLNWDFISLNDSIKSQQNQRLHLSKSHKLKVSNLSFFWIPQENYSLFNIENFSTMENNNTFTKKRMPLFYLTNRQGLKKPIYSPLDGFIHLTSSPKTKIRIQKPVKNQIKLGHFTQLNIKSSSTLLNSLKTLKTSLKTKLVQSFKKKWLSNDQKKKEKKVCLRFSKKEKNKDSMTTKIAYFSFKPNYLNLLPLKKTMENKNLETPFPVKDSKKALFLENIQRSTIQPLSISVRPGWIYLFKNFQKSLSLHQIIIKEGKVLDKDICFEQNNIYTELVLVQAKTIKYSVKNKPFKEWSSSSTIINSKNRFISSHLNLKILNKKTKDKGLSQNQLAILIRPMYYKSLENTQHFKTLLYNSKKKENPSLSLFNYKNYHSNLFNLQTSNRRFLGTVPLKDFVLLSNFRLPNKKKKTEKGKKVLFWNLRRKDSMIKEDLNLVQKFPTLNYSKEKLAHSLENFVGNLHQRSISFKNEKLYFSAFPVHFQPLLFKTEKSFSLNAGFIIPFLRFNTSNSFVFQRLNKSISNSIFLNFVFRKALWTKSKQEETFGQKAFTQGQYKGNNKLLSENVRLELKILQSYEILNSLPFFYDLPCFEFSMSQKYATFTDQRILLSEFLNVKKPSIWSTSVRIPSTTPSSLNFYPNTNHDFVLNNYNSILRNTSFAKTNFLSPYDGEIISSFTKGMLNKTSETFDSTNKWWEFSENTFFSKKTEYMHIFITKKDLFSFFFPKSEKYTKIRFLTSSYSQTNPFFSKYPFGKKQNHLSDLYQSVLEKNKKFKSLEQNYYEQSDLQNYKINEFKTKYKNKLYKLKNLNIGYGKKDLNLRLGKFLVSGDFLYSDSIVTKPGQIIHMNSQKITLRHAEPFSVSPKGILHAYHDQYIFQNSPVVTLPFQTLKTGDIVQGIPKVEQYFEARTTQKGRLVISSLPVLLQGIFERYCGKLPLDQAVRQSVLKIQQMVVDGVQRVYRSQGVSIADKHLEIVVRQMTSKVQIIHGGQTGFFPGEYVDLEFVERVNLFLTVKIRYQPVVLGITRASLEVESFLSAASFQQTTKILAKASLARKKDFLKGLKENLLVGNLIPSGTGYVIPMKDFSN